MGLVGDVTAFRRLVDRDSCGPDIWQRSGRGGISPRVMAIQLRDQPKRLLVRGTVFEDSLNVAENLRNIDDEEFSLHSRLAFVRNFRIGARKQYPK